MADGLRAEKRQLHDTRNGLLRQHPYYADDIDRLFWYAAATPIRFGAAGPKNGVDLAALGVKIDQRNTSDDGYWLPHPDLRGHIVSQAEKEIGRLNRLDGGKLGNPNFHRFHSVFSAELAGCEINDTVRLSDLDPDSGSIVVAKATYLDQVGTNITADTPIALPPQRRLSEKSPSPFLNRTCRQADSDENGRLKPLDACVQANTIGVACVAIDKDNRVIARLRGYNAEKARTDDVTRRLGAMNRGWHCFSSGVLEWDDVAKGVESGSADMFCAGLTEGMRREIWYETGFPHDGGDYTIAPYAYARELKRAGKPQFFFLTKFHSRTAEEICAQIEANAEAGVIREASEYGTIPASAATRMRQWLSRKTPKKNDFWIMDPGRNRRFDQARLADLSGSGHLGETFTYELYGALLMLADAPLDAFFERAE